MRGTEPDNEALEGLRLFLATHCDKPDGITIERSDVISDDAARGCTATVLARRYLDGPPKTSEPAPAFLYVLFYNDALSVKSWPKPTGKGASLLMVPNREVANPYAESWPYPAVCFNTGFTLGFGTEGILQHEAGHILGLVQRQDGAGGAHCRNWGCGMQGSRAYLTTFSWLRGPPTGELCTDCQAELRQLAKNEAPANLRYIGPVLVRSEPGYDVLHLPRLVTILVGDTADQRDCDSFVNSARAQQPDDRLWISCKVTDEVLADPGKVATALTKLQNDPDLPLRQMGPALLVRVCAQRFNALRQFTNTVRMLERLTQMKPKDAGAYNQLAWVKATCPDESARNGAEAIAAATKACELSSWMSWQFIDTLAAAYAEASEFDKAIECQQRALRTGNSTEAQQNQMQARLSLYRLSKPYRSN